MKYAKYSMLLLLVTFSWGTRCGADKLSTELCSIMSADDKMFLREFLHLQREYVAVLREKIVSPELSAGQLSDWQERVKVLSTLINERICSSSVHQKKLINDLCGQVTLVMNQYALNLYDSLIENLLNK